MEIPPEFFADETITEVLQKNFGFQQFRSGQLTAIKILLNENNLLCIQPTGHGKSLLYQLPALLLKNITVVISPLLALMRDQLQHLNQRFAIPAASLNTDQSEQENRCAENMALQNKLRILFISPEQLDNLTRVQFLQTLPISLIVVDEAHCISSWGHDFRPSYRQIINFIKLLAAKNPFLKILGLTATANAKTEQDIKQQLAGTQRKIQVLRASMNRPNIQLSVFTRSGLAEKIATVLQLLAQLPGIGLIYCATREHTELLAEILIHQGIYAQAYHAGFTAEQKRGLQQAFINNQYKIIVATNALGMGIDKADLRFIIHFDIPGSITAYYQEIGRAGRDGATAYGILIYDPSDQKIQQYFIDSSQSTMQDFQSILTIIENHSQPLSLLEIKRYSGLHPTRVTIILAELIEQNYLTKKLHKGKQVYLRTDKQGQADLTRYKIQFQVKTQELTSMINYAEHSEHCLMATLRKALGDTDIDSCGHCNRCQTIQLQLILNPVEIDAINQWLLQRIIKIKAKKFNKIYEGIAVLDGKLRSQPFISFMRSRIDPQAKNLGLSDGLRKMLLTQILNLKQNNQFVALIPIPSRTWIARNDVAQWLADQLTVPVIDCLRWQQLPLKRQGELLNNDQRQHNVSQLMIAEKINQQLSHGAILLLDDYVGSGATINEAARALRQQADFNYPIIPFVIAAVQWHLGKPGMV